MRIRLRLRATNRRGVFEAGTVIEDWPDEMTQPLVQSGVAEVVQEEAEPTHDFPAAAANGEEG